MQHATSVGTGIGSTEDTGTGIPEDTGKKNTGSTKI